MSTKGSEVRVFFKFSRMQYKIKKQCFVYILAHRDESMLLNIRVESIILSGKEHIEFLERGKCTNLPEAVSNWASSVDTHRSCAVVCELPDCQGTCHRVLTNQGISKLRLLRLNDRISSVKDCFTF